MSRKSTVQESFIDSFASLHSCFGKEIFFDQRLRPSNALSIECDSVGTSSNLRGTQRAKSLTFCVCQPAPTASLIGWI